MAGYEDVLERVLIDPDFRDALGRDPTAALAGYQLAAHEIEVLTTQLTATATTTTRHAVEDRTSKAGLAGLLGAFGGTGRSGGGGLLPDPDDGLPGGGKQPKSSGAADVFDTIPKGDDVRGKAPRIDLELDLDLDPAEPPAPRSSGSVGLPVGSKAKVIIVESKAPTALPLDDRPAK